eukprot:COSAG02_NODE_11231_length_1766_cov_0.896221_2_plen_194_part_00
MEAQLIAEASSPSDAATQQQNTDDISPGGDISTTPEPQAAAPEPPAEAGDADDPGSPSSSHAQQQRAASSGSMQSDTANERDSGDAGRKSPRGDSLRRSGIGSGLMASVMGIDVSERANPLSPEEAAALGERLPEGPFSYYIVVGEITLASSKLLIARSETCTIDAPFAMVLYRCDSACNGSTSARGRVQEGR